ncbi:small polypeptide DEVIL 11-like, partial [Zingiber officinale]|uniref:small polypeptide DEVIL 11-like n=1 Tax=Zingiber officinale TaxID=94328 RepID=UPI001C4D057E
LTIRKKSWWIFLLKSPPIPSINNLKYSQFIFQSSSSASSLFSFLVSGVPFLDWLLCFLLLLLLLPREEVERRRCTVHMDEKWKLSKKGSRNGSRRSSASTATEAEAAAGARPCSRRCARLVREQRARFYIMRRCVTMLVCWREC